MPDSTPKSSDSKAMTMVSAPLMSMKSVRECTVNSCVTDAPSRSSNVKEVRLSSSPTSMICAMIRGMKTSSTTSNTTNTDVSTDAPLYSPTHPSNVPRTPLSFGFFRSDI